MKDLSGARITSYVESDRAKIVSLVEKRFSGVGDKDSVIVEIKDKEGKFYRATHCIVRIKDDELVGRYQNLKGLGCEVQVCSLLAHVFNEIEHDLRYKPLSGTLSQEEDSLLDGLGHLVESGDIIINSTLSAVGRRQKVNTAEFEDEYDFVVRMRAIFTEAENFRGNAGQLFEVCTSLGLTSPKKIQTALNWREGLDLEGIRLAKRLADVVNPNQNIQLEIDPLSSDQLLVLLLRENWIVEKLKDLYPSGRGIGRAPRFLSVERHLRALPSESSIATDSAPATPPSAGQR